MSAWHDAGASAEMKRVAALPERELAAIFARGERPDVASMIGWIYRGANTHVVAKAAGIGKFVKGFYRDAGAEEVRGYNIPVVPDALDRPWQLQPNVDAPKRFGFYRVAPVDPTAPDNAHLHAVLLDYGAVPGKMFDPVRTLRDYVVRVDPGSDDLLLGRAFARVGPAAIPLSWFLLERLAKTDFAG